MICLSADDYANLGNAGGPVTFSVAPYSNAAAAAADAYMSAAAAAAGDYHRGCVIDQLQNMLSREYDFTTAAAAPQLSRTTENAGVAAPPSSLSAETQRRTASLRTCVAASSEQTSRRDPVKERKRKDVHNMIERKRRYNINDRIKDLATLLPKSWTQQMKLNKGSILRATVEYLKFVNDERRRFGRWRRLRFDDDDHEKNDISNMNDRDDRSINDDDDFYSESLKNDDYESTTMNMENDQEDQILRIPVSITKSIDQNRAITITNYHYPNKNDV